ncbi:putative toxin-antitoxin system toxin component, PIN family [Dactylococcopsis salina]|uniref:Toxin-antitoxin system toxin component, PIN family n=1 Tax=Dactylococcopsis salina (strain PCC 8305) TaxID=13035 RepID=K9YSB1_DACS8|nr:putative toxin-antitoxin system toxin component, PIN family [Dactylococcopsis salina]AFZ49220.1 putative toxin-antitoxin system toxin component, PIN family [Dactylococcopsis salina PCC 8305]
MSNSRIVIDTNVIVSALIFSNSTTMRAFSLAQTRGIILMSFDLISELIDVLNRKKFDRYVSRETRETFLASLSTETELIETTEAISICRDPKDNKFLELAVSGNASYIVTGDKDLLELHPFQDVLILTPADFIRYFAQK